MTGSRRFLRVALGGLAGLLGATSPARADDPPAAAGGVEVLARGPVHEAFAQPAGGEPSPGPVAPKEPPKAIDELPPDQRPEGDNVQWVPGYWSWDDEARDYVWVSGLWRMAPAGRRWLPGHWQPVDAGWQWVSGVWAAATAAEVQYLPAPPPTLDQGPSAPAPDANSTYVNGLWTYQQTRYYWRPGYWVVNQPNWVWCPATYTWTPAGCLYTDGYWDHPFDQRGLLFAPVRFGPGWAGGPYTPRYVVGADFLLGALFVRPAGRHYCFGDYFEARYATAGYVAWPDYRVGRTGYDPTYAYFRQRHAADPRWEPALRDLYRARGAGEVPRPPRTLGQQVRAVNALAGSKTGDAAVHKNIGLTNAQNVTALAPLKDVHTLRVTGLAALGGGKAPEVPAHVIRLESVPAQEHARIVTEAAGMRDAAQERHQAEARLVKEGGAPAAHTDPPRTVRLALPKTPDTPAAVRPTLKTVPPVPVAPRHEDRPIPKAEPPAPKQAPAAKKPEKK